MMKVGVLAIIASLLFVQLCNAAGCGTFTASDGTKYALEALTTSADYIAMETGANNYKYNYQFCQPTKLAGCGTGATQPAVSQAKPDGTNCISVGYMPPSISELPNKAGVNIQYINTVDNKCGPAKDVQRTSNFVLLCNKAVEYLFLNITEPGVCQYTFTASTKHACPGGSPGPSPGKKGEGLSPGSIFLIAFFVSAVVYLIAGAAVKWKMYSATGVDMVPNIEFWSQLPGLIRDGCLFVKNKITGKLGYSSL